MPFIRTFIIIILCLCLCNYIYIYIGICVIIIIQIVWSVDFGGILLKFYRHVLKERIVIRITINVIFLFVKFYNYFFFYMKSRMNYYLSKNIFIFLYLGIRYKRVYNRIYDYAVVLYLLRVILKIPLGYMRNFYFLSCERLVMYGYLCSSLISYYMLWFYLYTFILFYVFAKCLNFIISINHNILF